MAAPTFPRNLNRHRAQTGLIKSADGSKAKGVAEMLETGYFNGHASGGLTNTGLLMEA